MSWWFFRSKAEEAEADVDTSPSPEATPSHTIEDRMLNLQRSAGNQSVQRMVAKASSEGADKSPPEPTRSGGEPLPQGTREFMESRFGESFDDVRIHADEEAAASAVTLGANAYTTGRDVYFAPGKYVPESPDGQRLLAHELTHVVQQSSRVELEGEPHLALEPEAEATRAADRVASGAPLDFAPSPVSASGPALSPDDWSKDVTDAKTAKDGAAMCKLMETALAATKRKIIVAKTSPGGNIDPKDYKPLPDLNFDLNLNSKKSKPLSSGSTALANTHSLAINQGYSFTDSGKTYIVFGPEALSEESPVFTRMHYEHELYHTTHHFGAATKPATPAPTTPAKTNEDVELETYTQDFLNFFHQLHTFMPQWTPLIGFYERASTAAQASALALLKGYYNSPPSPPIAAADVPKIKKSFERWLRRRLKDSSSKKLVQDLSKDLSITLSAPSSGGTPSPAPTSALGDAGVTP